MTHATGYDGFTFPHGKVVADFFISYHSSDQPWADWLAWVLEENGHSVTLQEGDVDKSGMVDIGNLDPFLNQIRSSQQIITLLSERYILPNELFDQIVSRARLKPETNLPVLLPIRVESYKPQAEINLSPYLDLVDKSEVEAEQTILETVRQGVPPQPPIAEAAANELSPSITALATKSTSRSKLQLHRRPQQVQGFSEQLSNDLSLAMVKIPAGTFLMGSPDNELERQDREGPQHEVNITNFFIGKYPITQVQWRFVAGLSPVNLWLNPNPARFDGDTHPVEQISWPEAVEFCDRLSLHTGRPYRLPTEAEWEYACRADTTTPFHFGETITTDLANYNGADEQHGAYGRGPRGENRQTTTPVDHFGIANGFGLCDMHGNVWEWCQDQWRSTYGDEASKRKIKAAPQPDQSTHRVARGGSWYTPPHRCRSASRIHFGCGSFQVKDCNESGRFWRSFWYVIGERAVSR